MLWLGSHAQPFSPVGKDTKTVVKQPHLGFSHLFNSYAQAINRRYGRTGSLFDRPFRRVAHGCRRGVDSVGDGQRDLPAARHDRKDSWCAWAAGWRVKPP